MPSIDLIQTFLRELVTLERAERVTEPDLVMDDPEKVAAFTRAGREDGVMAPVYLFHCAQICEVVRPGDTVLDLGCGPGTQLGMVARLNPEVNFIGLDMSGEMLKKAEEHFKDEGLSNIRLYQGDVADLSDFSNASIDAVMSTVVLHHLPTLHHLDSVFAEVARILKPSGGLYLVDFGRLKSSKSIEYFAYQYADRQPELFTLDYLYSLRAAFSKEDFQRLTAKYLEGRAFCHSMFLMPFMVAIKSRKRGQVSAQCQQELRRLKKQLPVHHRGDLRDLKILFFLGGMPCSLL